LGLVEDARWDAFNRKRDAVAREAERLKSTWVNLDRLKNLYKSSEDRYFNGGKRSLYELLQRPGVSYGSVMTLPGAGGMVTDPLVAEQIEIQAKYHGYIQRQKLEVARNEEQESRRLPADLDYCSVRGLSKEIQQTLNRHRPETLGQAARISGVTPAAISLLLVHLKRGFEPRKKSA